MREQDKLSIMEEPAFTMEQVDKEMAKVTKLAKKIFGKKKPKEPKKKEKVEVVDDEEFDDEGKTKEQSDAGSAEDKNDQQNQESAGYEDEL